MIKYAFVVLLLGSFPHDHVGDLQSTGLPTSGGSLSGGDIVDLDDIYGTAITSDAAISPVQVESSKPPYPGVGATNNAGANLCKVPSSGNQQLTGVTKAGTAGDTITIRSIDLECALTTTVITEGDGSGGSYECDGAASDAECVANLYAVLAAAGTAGKFGATYTAASETLVIYPVVGTSVWVNAIPSDATNTVITHGTDGIVLAAPSLNASGTTGWNPSYAIVGDPDTGLAWTAANTLAVTTAGTMRFNWSNSAAYSYVPIGIVGQSLFWYSYGRINSLADGKFKLSDNAAAHGVIVDVSNDVASFRDIADSAQATGLFKRIDTANNPITLGAGVTTFNATSNVMTITGDGGGNTIATITPSPTSTGMSLFLIFVDNKVAITDTDVAAAGTVDLSAAFTSADDTTLSLVFDGTSWFETSRSVN